MYARLLQGEISGTDALEASQQMLQILMDSMANAVFWKDLNSCYMGCNKVFARFAGVEPDVLIGMSDRDMPWADSQAYSADWFIDWDRKVIETGEPHFGIVEQLRSAAGEVRWLQTNKVPLRDLDGRVIGVLGTFEDITERRRAEDIYTEARNQAIDPGLLQQGERDIDEARRTSGCRPRNANSAPTPRRCATPPRR